MRHRLILIVLPLVLVALATLGVATHREKQPISATAAAAPIPVPVTTATTTSTTTTLPPTTVTEPPPPPTEPPTTEAPVRKKAPVTVPVTDPPAEEPVADPAPAYQGNSTGDVNGYPCGGDLPPCYVLARESGGNPTVANRHSTASGLWQFLDTTWAGFGGYARAMYAPPGVQNQRAVEVWNGGRGCSAWAAC